jgi:hypothetical protein
MTWVYDIISSSIACFRSVTADSDIFGSKALFLKFNLSSTGLGVNYFPSLFNLVSLISILLDIKVKKVPGPSAILP